MPVNFAISHDPFDKDGLLNVTRVYKNNTEHKRRISVHKVKRSFSFSFHDDYKHIKTFSVSDRKIKDSVDNWVILLNTFLTGGNYDYLVSGAPIDGDAVKQAKMV